ncbi:restriction endonuclease subunit S (plasmid) [Bacillus cereus]|uniref:restriction endonuclease subunit S n=1 Tax=Bacillus cereus TaxID=1396 RepID=UPI001120FE99|nr:restriction endonuclease subunit S [Bacillus cereus]UDW09522.1 restriction endonuclease subunit S [Bacillus cereus]
MEFKGKIYSLAELYDISSGLSKKREEFGFGYPFLTFKEVFHNIFLPAKLEELANTTEKEQMKCSIRVGDVFLTRTSEKLEELGLSSVALKDYLQATFNGFTKRLRPNKFCEEILLPEYAAFYFRSPKFRNQVTSFSSMTTRASLNNEMISKLTIDIPPLAIQKSIVEIMLSLLEKEKNNKQTIQTLEELSQTLFKHWFIDFEFPNEQGQPYKSSGGEMIDSELGEIPKEWKVGTASNLFDFSPTEKLSKGALVKYVEMKDLQNSAMIYHYTDREFKSGSKFRNGDTLLARITPCLENGKIGFVDFLDKNEVGWGSTEFIVIRTKPEISKTFSYFFAADSAFKDYAIINMNGSSGRQRVKAETLAQYKVAIPPLQLIKQFTDIADANMRMMTNLKLQINKLEQLRDTLLPKLLSGEIKIPDELEV